MKKLKKLFDLLGKVIAVSLVVIWVLLLVNAQWAFLPAWLFNIFSICKEYGTLVLLGVVGLEAMSDKPFIFRVIFYALCAIIVIFLFFPGTYANLISLVK